MMREHAAVPEAELLQHLRSCLRVGRLAGLWLLDLHHFRLLCHGLGDDAGAAVLTEVERRLRCALTGRSRWIARVGADEFAVLDELTGSVTEQDGRASELDARARELLALLVEPVQAQGEWIPVDASVGAAVTADGHAASLWAQAQTALAAARALGAGQVVVYSPDIGRGIQERIRLLRDLRRAVAQGEFYLEYQPRVHAWSGRITGAEALIRWLHPRRGMVPPGEFIPMAEESGLIVPIGQWVLREVCRQLREWQRQGMPLVRVAVNVSRLQIQSSDFARTMQQILEEYGVDPHWLEVEITESTLLLRAEAVRETLQKLQSMGVRVALDDFGIGYSTLSTLCHLPVNTLKLDRSFLQWADDAAVQVASAIIELGHRLRMWVVGEGVETARQWQFLRDHRCDELQGFLFSRPLPAAEFARVLAAETLHAPASWADVEGVWQARERQG
ncbi:MAG: EAL domain-containing protein [Alicyclobacillus sp.]|nr:EAL domain-containing protein [Alicyclobacillus sp.]